MSAEAGHGDCVCTVKYETEGTNGCFFVDMGGKHWKGEKSEKNQTVSVDAPSWRVFADSEGDGPFTDYDEVSQMRDCQEAMLLTLWLEACRLCDLFFDVSVSRRILLLASTLRRRRRTRFAPGRSSIRQLGYGRQGPDPLLPA